MISECVRTQFATMVFSLIACLVASPGVRAQAAPDYATLMAAPDRSDADRKADTRRDPLPLLAFADLRPGMKVLDMGAGGGYSTELIARAVAPGGIVYGQNAPDLGEKAKAAFDARLKTAAMKDALAEVRPFDDPAPPGVHDLDLITFLFYYHDTTYMNVDRAEMDRNMFAVLKPGGFLVIADHSALPGQGTSVGKTLHRMEESTLRKEVEAAGFRVVAEGNFWRVWAHPWSACLAARVRPARWHSPKVPRPGLITIHGLISNCAGPRGRMWGRPRRAPECRRSVRAGRVGCLNQGLNLPNLFSHDPTDRFGVTRVEPVLEPSVALARRATGAFGATVHATPATTPYGRPPAGMTGAGLCPTSAGCGHIRQSPRNVHLTHGVVFHFSLSPSRSFPGALTIPTTPWAPEWMWRCLTSTVCLCPRRCRSRAWIMSSCSRRSLTA
jgi:predicted methyltransferase